MSPGHHTTPAARRKSPGGGRDIEHVLQLRAYCAAITAALLLPPGDHLAIRLQGSKGIPGGVEGLHVHQLLGHLKG